MSEQMQVHYADPLELIPYSNNPRINDYAVKKVMGSIEDTKLRWVIVMLFLICASASNVRVVVRTSPSRLAPTEISITV